MPRKVLTNPEPFISIIAVHGLGCDAETTWKAADQCVWLAHSLPGQLDTAGFRATIWSYAYDARELFLNKSARYLPEEAEILLQEIDTRRQSDMAKARPIVFVAHSLGGYLVKKVSSPFYPLNTHLTPNPDTTYR
jgi:hypothetical protein